MYKERLIDPGFPSGGFSGEGGGGANLLFCKLLSVANFLLLSAKILGGEQKSLRGGQKG